MVYHHLPFSRLRAVKRKTSSLIVKRFAEEDILAALDSVVRAMSMADDIIQDAESAHFAAFMQQLAAWEFDPFIFSPEPYLEEVKLNFAHQYVSSMEKLFVRIESYLHDVNNTSQKSGISFYGGDSAQMQLLDNTMQWKAFTDDATLQAQIDARILQEAYKVQRRLQRNLDARRQTRMGVEEYIWRSADDDKVRHSHAEHDDQTFRWDTPPPGGHPGQDYGCRCYAEPVRPQLSEEEMRTLVDRDAITPLYPELFLIGIGRAGWLGAKLAAEGIKSIIQRTSDRATRYKTEKLFRRPEGVPKDWVESSTKHNDGIVYTKPDTKGTTYIKMQKAKPNSANRGQQYDNVRWMRNGESFDKNGNIVSRESLESHIPVKDFKFRPELFK